MHACRHVVVLEQSAFYGGFYSEAVFGDRLLGLGCLFGIIAASFDLCAIGQRDARGRLHDVSKQRSHHHRHSAQHTNTLALLHGKAAVTTTTTTTAKSDAAEVDEYIDEYCW